MLVFVQNLLSLELEKVETLINHIVYCSTEIMLLLKFFQGLLGILG